jgi:hypothetical protein
MMAGWLHRVKIKHLYVIEEDHNSIQTSMNAIADILAKDPCFHGFDVKRFRTIPEGDDVFGPVDYANPYLSDMYDFADYNRIWIE